MNNPIPVSGRHIHGVCRYPTLGAAEQRSLRPLREPVRAEPRVRGAGRQPHSRHFCHRRQEELRHSGQS